MATGLAAIALAAQGPGRGGRGFFPGGPGGPGMPQERKIVAQFDKDGDGRLNAGERREARQWLQSQPAQGPGGGRGWFGRGRAGGVPAGSPGERLTPADVKSYGNEPLYDPAVLRTLFFQFENDDWEAELEAFSDTDVEVPATMTVDGRVYRDVGLHFRGASSLFSVPRGLKRSLNVSLDWVHGRQALRGYRTLSLLNSHDDPTYLRTVLFMQAARNYLPAPKANHVRVALNGESWGIYVNAQQFNKEFVNEWFKTDAGARWKIPGSPGARGGLEYLGDDPELYKRAYEIKSKDDRKACADFIRLCRTLNMTPPDQLEGALAPMLDIDGALTSSPSRPPS